MMASQKLNWDYSPIATALIRWYYNLATKQEAQTKGENKTMIRESYRQMSRDEQKAFIAEMATWLNDYTDEVCNHVIKNHIEEIITTPSTRALLKELHERTQKSFDNFTRNLDYMIEFEEEANRPDNRPHLDVLSHADAYRTVLYDLYIADMHEKGAKA